jgi:hydrogenase maturation factor HypF (carbamoyltransferase family)
MPLRYFKPELLIATSCEHCGTQHRETLARLYSDAPLLCRACGHEHTSQRHDFRQTVEQTEALVAKLPLWMEKAISRLHNWCNPKDSAPFS